MTRTEAVAVALRTRARRVARIRRRRIASTNAPVTTKRDPYADFLRAFSLLVVVLWHWCFTILIWTDDGPFATSPLGFTSGLWILTWLLQVLPVFFYIGAFVHLKSWERARERGEPIWHFALRQARELAVPSVILLATWIVLGIIVGTVFDLGWMGRAVMMVVSPLWFIATYLFFVALMPVTYWLHQRFDSLVLIMMGGLAIVVDVLRFRYHVPTVEWANMVFVWGFAFQLGYFRDQISGLTHPAANRGGTRDWAYQDSQTRRRAWSFTLVGLFGLFGLVFSGLYPGSMVGVPGQGSNMAPPTVCILALTAFQVGLAELIRPWVLRHLAAGGPFARLMSLITAFALPLFLFHTTGMALSRAVEWVIFGISTESTSTTLMWWLLRPVAIIGPLLATLPVIWVFVWRQRRRDRAAAERRRAAH